MKLLRFTILTVVASASAIAQSSATVEYNDNPCKSLGQMALILGSVCRPTITIVAAPPSSRDTQVVGFSIVVRYISSDGDSVTLRQLLSAKQDGVFVAYFYAPSGITGISATATPLFSGQPINAVQIPSQ